MIPKKAIKVIERHIEQLNKNFKEAEKRSEEPEMVSDLEFSLNEMANIELEIIEMQFAIKVLNENK